MIDMTFLFPVYNEEKRLRKGIEETIRFLNTKKRFIYQIFIIDNGSNDMTDRIGLELQSENDSVKYFKIPQKGVGVAIRNGAKLATSKYIGYMDIDLSTDLNHLNQVADIFENKPTTKIVNGSRLSLGAKVIGRKLSREIASRGLNFILKFFLKMKLDDSLCGFKFFELTTLKNLITESSDENGWFFCVEVLLRAERGKISIEEIPVVWTDDYNTTVNIMKLICQYLTQIFRLYFEFSKDNKGKKANIRSLFERVFINHLGNK